MDLKINDKRPALYQRSACNIWTDPYVREQLLKEHLDISSDGASRNAESIRRTVDFISAHTRPAGSLLDLGCGPGLYATRFRDRGYAVTGVDFNAASVEYAVRERPDINYVLADYITDYPAGRFDAVLMIYCDFGTHSDRDRSRLLESIYGSLDEGGKFIFDVFTPALIRDRQESKSWDYAPSGGFWSPDEYLLLSQTFHYLEDRVFGYQYNLITGSGNKHFIVWERYFSEAEITAVLKQAGFGRVAVYRDVTCGNDFTSDSEIFVVAEK